jgi:hypothetical protein
MRCGIERMTEGAGDGSLHSMVAVYLHRALSTRNRDLPDGRRITLRRAVPSDAPRLACLGADPNAAWGYELVALDDHGAIVGHASSPSEIVVAPDWTWSGLRAVLAREVEEA